ncbi:T9SS type B sorting domain-containing protein [Polaribacter sp. R77954]|uniref:T9SS type B sorting domain-containing protein n=1 Tax=Polaribacter sp. R77954 TaxID=3093870 RepID=UPI0037CB338A
MKNLLSLIFCFLFYLNINAQITLTHNVGNTPIKTDWESCDYQEYWARTFTLADFGIETTDQFIVRSGQIAISNSYDGARLSLGIYAIDSNFPNSTAIHIGGGGILAPKIDDSPEIIQINFNTPAVIPSNTERILVVATQSDDIYNADYKKVLIAGTEQDKDTSWFQGCRELYTYTSTEDLSTPVLNANFFINVTGEKLSTINSDSNITLSHNIGDDVKKTKMHSCSSSYQYWARKFVLEDFGINENEEYIIDKGFVGLSAADWKPDFQFNIYSIDENFPDSFSELDLIGSSQTKEFPYFSFSGNNARIMLIDFETPIVVPADVKMILVEVLKGVSYGSATAFIAGTENDTGDSWYKGCGYSGDTSTYYTLNSMNFFITVNGEAKTIFPFEITNDNICSNFSNNLSLTNQSEIKSVVWNFDDPVSGANNTSTNIDVNHQFSSAGIYNITATVTHIDNTVYTIPKEVEIFEAPNINPSVSLKQCDNADIDGFSFFNLNEVKEKIITDPKNYRITFYEDEAEAENNGTAITNSTQYENETVSVDKIWARVENTNGCYKVGEVNLFVSTTQIPINYSKSFYQCDDGDDFTDGIATFNFSSVSEEITNIFPPNQQLIINYYQNEFDALKEENAIADISNYQNTNSPNQQIIYIRVDSEVDNDCLGLGAHIVLNVEKAPIANLVSIQPECDNDKDGFFSFDTSNIQSTIIGNQTNVAVSYFDEKGNQLSSPLPNPFTTASQKITARIVNTNSQDLDGQCFDETEINFIVNTVPTANAINVQEACDDDFDGSVAFNTSNIQSTIIGTQTNLIVKYFDENNAPLPSPLPNPFNTSSQTIRVRLENPLYDVCFEETTIDFVVNEKPSFDLITEDIICMNSNPRLEIKAENPLGNYSYLWTDENGATVGTSQAIDVFKGGVYTVMATSDKGCNSDEMRIKISESSASTISMADVTVQDDSDNNFIKVNTTNLGLGDYEFRLLNENYNIVYDYQDDPNFENLDGGIYTLEVNDKNNCGTMPLEISLISFPSFFTPNGDGKNDYWQIKGLNNSFYKSGLITIFNRFGKQIAKFTITDMGWNGTYNGKPLPSNNFWYQVVLVSQNDVIKTRTGNFSLIRN